MTLKIFSDRQWKEFKEIYCWSLRQRFGIMLLYMALLFLALPMILLLVIQNGKESIRLGAPVTNLADSFSGALRILLPVLVVPLTLLFILILSVMLYNYMHQKRSVDYFHSLPAGRTPLLLGKYFAGLTLIFVPLIINFSIVAIIIAANGLGATTPIINIVYNLLWAMFMVIASFSFTVLMAVCSGTTMDMVISAIVINLSYPILIMLCQFTSTCILPGLDFGDNFLTVYAFALAPYAAAFVPFLPKNYSGDTMGTSFTVWWILMTLVLFIACIALYDKRKSESAENNFAFPLPKIIIRFVATAAVGLGLGIIFLNVTSDNNSVSFFLGVAAGSLITHIIAEAIYSRGFKGLKKSFVYYGAFVILFLAAYIPLSLGFFGYDTRIPAAADVASVSFDSPYGYSGYYNGTAKVLDGSGNVLSIIEGKLTSRDSIEQVRTLHQIMIDVYKQRNYPYKLITTRGGKINITYHLKNGRTVTRSYNSYDILENNSNVQSLCMKIQDSKEYKTSGNLIYYLEPEYIQNIQVDRKAGTGSNLEPSKAVSRELIDALQQDMASTTLSASANPDTIQLNIYFADYFVPKEGSPLKKLIGNYSGKVHLKASYSGQYVYMAVPKSYTHTQALIEKYGWIK